MPKILLFPDLHHGYDNYQVIGTDGIPSRRAEWLRAADALVEIAQQEECTVAMSPGDAFTSGKHSSQAIIDVYRLYSRLEREAGCKVVGILGNHDYAGAAKQGPVDVLARVGSPLWGLTQPDLIDLTDVQIAVLPWVKASSLLEEAESAGDLNSRASAALAAIVYGLAAQVDPSRPSILLGHWSVSGSRLSSGQTLLGGEPTLTLGDLQAGPWNAVVMGHIHKRQEFPGTPWTMHTGALIRRDFGEENDECGCYVFDTDTNMATWHPVPTRRFLTIDLRDEHVEYLTHGHGFSGLLANWHEAGDEPVEGKIVRVRYRTTEEQHRRIDQAALIRDLEAAGAHVVAGVIPEIIRADRTRAQVDEETSPLDALQQWLDLQAGMTLTLRADVRAAAEELLKGVQY